MEEKLNQAHYTDPIRRTDVMFWLWWVVSTTVTGSLSYFSAGAIVSLRAQADTLGQLYGGANFLTGDSAIASAILWGFLLLILVGPSVGLAQAIVLRRMLSYEDWGKWAVATASGVAVAFAAMAIQGIGVLLAGIAIGAMQWSVLRRLAHNAGLWILSSTIALGIGLALGVYVALNFLPSSWVSFPSWPFYPLTSVIYWTCVLSICLVVYASITGMVLVMLLRKSASP